MTESSKVNEKNSTISPLAKINVVVESADNKSPAENSSSKKSLSKSETPVKKVQEFGGRGGLEPTRFGDWEKNGRCIDF